jgi:ATP-binding cassette subfamily B protein
LVVPLLVFGALQVLPTGEARWRISDTLGNRVGDILDERTMRAFLDPPGIAHLDDPAVRDAADRAATFWNSSILEGVLSVLVVRVTGAAAAVLLGLAAGWLPAVALAAVWLLAGRWSWRAARTAMDVQFAQSPELRDAAYAAELGVEPAAAKEVRVFGMAPWLAARHARLWRDAMSPLWRRRRRDALPSVAIAAAVALVNGGVVLWLGSRALNGAINTAALAVAIQALVQVADLGNVPYGHWEMEYGLRTVPAADELHRLVHSDRFALRGDRPATGLPRDSIRFESVGFAYPGRSAPVLDGVELDILAGSSLAIVGPNGAGKTTLVKLLCRYLDPTAGEILIDGVPLREIDPVAWHARLSGLFQEFVQYPLPARDNVAPDERVPLDVIRDAARNAGILDEIEALPEGWDTQLTRRFVGGAALSGGQWQRIALARALVGVQLGAGLLVLDEPTAHLDARAEADFYDRFLDLTRGITTVLISHRFSTVRRADRLAVLDGGRVIEAGTHDELIAHQGLYARLFGLQAAKFR